MAAQSTCRAQVNSGLGLGLVALGVGIFVLRRRATKHEGAGHESKEEAFTRAGPLAAPRSPRADVEFDAHSIKSRVGNFKVSKVQKLVEGIAQEFGADHLYDVRNQRVLRPAQTSSVGSDVARETEEEQGMREQRTFEEAARIMRLLRQSAVHRKLPHFHAVDRQLENAENFLSEIADCVSEFWRYGRDEPMADLMQLPIMQLAASGGREAIVPVTQGFVKHLWSQAIGPMANVSARQAEDVVLADARTALEESLKLLGVGADATAQEVESAFRRRSHKLHKHGHCIDLEAFHGLNNAYHYWLAHRVSPPRGAFAGGGDLLAHYLLIGTDPGESRYRECSVGIMDAVHRDRLLQKVEVLRNWGETSGSTTGLGQG
mmetsp:Transcript_19712/g.54153  ORF Transcript_19712/g.54153 Transcript_19712/m.54153 type:complete len:375 (+) Transcript_19712:51-1175(+)